MTERIRSVINEGLDLSNSGKIWEARQLICGHLFLFVEGLVNYNGNLAIKKCDLEYLFEQFLPQFIKLFSLWLERYIEVTTRVESDTEIEDRINLVNVSPDAAVISMRPTFMYALEQFFRTSPPRCMAQTKAMQDLLHSSQSFVKEISGDVKLKGGKDSKYLQVLFTLLFANRSVHSEGLNMLQELVGLVPKLVSSRNKLQFGLGIFLLKTIADALLETLREI